MSELSSISKGSKMYRMTTEANESDGNKYVTYFKPDRNYYKGPASSYISRGDKNKKLYEVSFKTKKDLNIATAKNVDDAFSELYKKDKKLAEKSAKAYADFFMQKYNVRNDKELSTYYDASKKGKKFIDDYMKKNFNNISDATLKADVKTRFKNLSEVYKTQLNKARNGISSKDKETSLFFKTAGLDSTEGKKIRTDLINALKNKGYHGMSDVAGMGGTGGYTREARQTMIIFDSDKNLDKKKMKKVSPNSNKRIPIPTPYGVFRVPANSATRASQHYLDWARKTKPYSNLIIE